MSKKKTSIATTTKNGKNTVDKLNQTPAIKKLTFKQDKFCHEYVLCMNQSEAYRRAFNTSNMKVETVWNKASILMKVREVRARVDELKNDVEQMLGINKTNQLNELLRIRNRCLKPEPKLTWVKNENNKMEQVQEEDEEGNLVYQFDSAGANSAQDKILKAMGYYAPTQQQQIGKDGKPIDIQPPTFKVEIHGSKSNLLDDDK